MPPIVRRTEIYPIGTPGEKWGNTEIAAWRDLTTVKREYQQQVVPDIEALKQRFDVLQYGALSYDTDRYPLLAVKTRNWGASRPVVLITGGVHGYETSGVHGAIQFLQVQAENYLDQFNIVVAPCVSPWGYETINRWNPNAVDPNRSFYANSPAQESASLMQFVQSLGVDILAHIDLHETTDTDESEFRPAAAARDGVEYVKGTIPDGFYLVGDNDKPVPGFQAAIIAAVKKVTHIAPPDEKGNIIAEPVTQEGVINYPTKALSLCSGITNCRYGTTTEVYPDSPQVSDELCNQAQVTAVTAALDYLVGRL